ncbi:MAG: hypothetical protein JOZ99_13545 [Actinobacteria bacterium]|nr:hypothetical protein [Actinomycetota bacterium]
MLFAAVAAGAVVLAACGGGSSSTTSSTSTAGSQSSTANRAALSAYRQCLQSHGVSFGGRRNGGTGTSGSVPDTGTPPSSRPPLTPAQQAQRQAAQQACQSKLPAGFAQQQQQDVAAYRSCLKDHGVNVPTTPSTNGSGFGGGGLQGLNRNDPTVQAAMKVCAPLLPNGGRFGSGGRGSSSSTPAALGAPAATKSAA